jgi:hypothetical protein
MHDRVRFRGGDGFTDRCPVEPVQHNAVGTQFFEQAELARAGRRGGHLMASRNELRHQSPSQDT